MNYKVVSATTGETVHEGDYASCLKAHAKWEREQRTLYLIQFND
jgi:hypothetical protein